jgi:hypothetical protein
VNVFLSGKETMSPQRGHISPYLMKALQMLKKELDETGDELVGTEQTGDKDWLIEPCRHYEG